MEPGPAATTDTLIPPAGLTADFTLPGVDAAADGDAYIRNSARAQELYALAVSVAAKGDDRQTMAHMLRAAKHAESVQEWRLAAVALHAVADLLQKPGPDHRLEQALRIYRRAIAAYEQCGEFDAARSLEYRVSALRLWHAEELNLSVFTRIEMFLYWLTAGFGYRPFRVVLCSVVLVLIFGVVYWAAGGVMDSEEEPVADFSSAAYFSGSTFLTINYGDLLPARHVRWVTVLEGLVGLTMTSFFVVVLANVLRR